MAPLTNEITTTGVNPVTAPVTAPIERPQTAEEVTPYLKKYQDALFSGASEPETRVPSVASLLGEGSFAVPEEFAGKNLSEIRNITGAAFRPDVLAGFLGIEDKTTLEAGRVFNLDVSDKGSAEFQFLQKSFSKNAGTGAVKPQALNRVAGFESLRESFGVADMEQGLNFLKAEQREMEAQLRVNTTDERGKVVPQSVMEGRISKQTQTARENLEFNQRQQTFLADQINTANSTIGLYMNFANLDYQDATARYDTEFQQNMQIAGLTRDIQIDERDFAAKQEAIKLDTARASLTTYQNAISSGNLNVNDLSQDQKLQLNKLETQAGLPIGFTASLKLSPSDKILATSSDKTQAWVIDENGNMTVIQTGLKKSSSGTGTKKVTDQEYKDALIEDIKGGAGLVEVLTFYSENSTISNKKIVELYDRHSPHKRHTETEEELIDAGFNL